MSPPIRRGTPALAQRPIAIAFGDLDGAHGRIQGMPKPWLILIGGLGATCIAVCGCDGANESLSRDGRPTASQSADRARVSESRPADCEIGRRPGYFVPGPQGTPLALLGCSRLAVSRKRVEFSANLAAIGGTRHLCINPAYNGRGHEGIYIPAICKLEPPPSRFAVRQASQPTQAVRDYELVIWGTAADSTSRVSARSAAGLVRAAVFEVDTKLAARFGEEPFSLFVLELPLRAACDPIVVRGGGPEEVDRIPPQPKTCQRA
jgi:hypothetical protein